MEGVTKVVHLVLEKGPEALAALNAVLVALIGICALIPGDQPEKTLQKVVDLISKISRKPPKAE